MFGFQHLTACLRLLFGEIQNDHRQQRELDKESIFLHILSPLGPFHSASTPDRLSANLERNIAPLGLGTFPRMRYLGGRLDRDSAIFRNGQM